MNTKILALISAMCAVLAEDRLWDSGVGAASTNRVVVPVCVSLAP
jgi:hypothetical protein